MYMKVVIAEKIDVLPEIYLSEIRKITNLKTYEDFPTSEVQILSRFADAEIAVVKWINFSEKVLDKAKQVKYIITLTSGFTHLPLVRARNKDITIVNCPSHNSNAVAEHVIALMFAVSRNITLCQTNLWKGNWRESPYSFLGTELSGKTLGIFGYGNIGKKVEKMAKGLGMNVVYVNTKSSENDHINLLKQSDYVSLNVPKTDKTYHLLDEKKLRLLKPTSYLINTSRGEIVDQKALYFLLKDGKVAGAGLDVFENSPAVGKAPKEIVDIARLPNVVATPHIAFNTREAGERMGKEFVDNIKAILKGKPINVVN